MKYADKIFEIMSKGEYRYYGIRTASRLWNVGDELPASFDALDYISDETPELPGTCATEIELLFIPGIADTEDEAQEQMEEIKAKLEFSSDFYGLREHLYLIAGNNDCTYGTDESEIIIENAVVVAALA